MIIKTNVNNDDNVTGRNDTHRLPQLKKDKRKGTLNMLNENA